MKYKFNKPNFDFLDLDSSYLIDPIVKIIDMAYPLIHKSQLYFKLNSNLLQKVETIADYCLILSRWHLHLTEPSYVNIDPILIKQLQQIRDHYMIVLIRHREQTMIYNPA